MGGALQRVDQEKEGDEAFDPECHLQDPVLKLIIKEWAQMQPEGHSHSLAQEGESSDPPKYPPGGTQFRR